MQGIYKIENILTGKVYIGQSVDISKRFAEHKLSLSENYHYNKYLQRSYNKYGIEKFSFEIIEECAMANLTEREQYWIDFYGNINSDKIYNLRDAGNLGTHSIETREKLREINLGKKTFF